MDNSEINKIYESLRKAIEEENLLRSSQVDVPKTPASNFMKESGISDREFATAIACCLALKRLLRSGPVSELIDYGESRGLAISGFAADDVAYVKEEKCDIIIEDWLSEGKMSDEIIFTYEYNIKETMDIDGNATSHRGIMGFFKIMSFTRTKDNYTLQIVDLVDFRDGVNLYITRSNR